MIRFLNKNLKGVDGIEVCIRKKGILLNENIWLKGKEYLKESGGVFSFQKIPLFPLVSPQNEIIGYGYQDAEADRELRMLREIQEIKTAFQFKDVFPNINSVVIHGCNELAYMFVKYLEKQSVSVITVGKYWKNFGYDYSDEFVEEDKNTLVIHAEGTNPKPYDLYYSLIKSVSSEFECIDKIYEKNVTEGRIKDAEGDFEWLLKQLEGKNIIVIGIDKRAQDTYDLLCANGKEICGFLRTNYKNWYTDDPDAKLKRKWGDRKEDTTGKISLLGKKIFYFSKVVKELENLVFIQCTDKNSALGTRDVEILDYYGYQRNKELFLIEDYIEVPHSNLIHILWNKNVVLAGDERLCHILSEYLEKAERGNIHVLYTDLSEKVTDRENSILCLVTLWFGRYGGFDEQQNYELFFDKMQNNGFFGYTDYFSSSF